MAGLSFGAAVPLFFWGIFVKNRMFTQIYLILVADVVSYNRIRIARIY